MSSNKDQVIFNVGGFMYKSSIDVVMKFPDSTLQIFCKTTHIYSSPDGRFEMREVTINRDGQHFGAILKHLRGEALKLRKWHIIQIERLQREADYYGLTNLVHDCDEEQLRREQQLKKCDKQKKKIETKVKQKGLNTTIEMESKVKKKKTKLVKAQLDEKNGLLEKQMAKKDTQTKVTDISENIVHQSLFFNIQPALDLIKSSGKLGIVADFEVLELLDDVNNICQLCHPIKVYFARLPTLIILYDKDLRKLMDSHNVDESVVVTKESQMNALRNFLDNLKTQYINKLYL